MCYPRPQYVVYYASCERDKYLLSDLEDGRDVPLRPHEWRIRFDEDTVLLAVVGDWLLLVQGLELRRKRTVSTVTLRAYEYSINEVQRTYFYLVDVRELQACLPDLLEMLHAAVPGNVTVSAQSRTTAHIRQDRIRIITGRKAD